MPTLLLISGVILLSVAIALTYRPVIPAAIVALGGLYLMRMSGELNISGNSMLFWCAATLLVLFINSLTSTEEQGKAKGVGYIVTGSMAGMFVGLLLSTEGIIVGSAAGALLGATAFCRTPAGASLRFPSLVFMRNLCAVGLPAIVAVCIIGIAIMGILAGHGGITL